MRGIFVGIDVGGTHTDGVAIEGGRIVHKAKVPTREDLEGCTLEALAALFDGIPVADVRRVVLSTTLVTNAVVEGSLESTGVLVTAGPGMNPAGMPLGPRGRVVKGAMDHRGREVAPLDEAAVVEHLAACRGAGVKVLAVAGKFSVRNPTHERRIAELAQGFDYVATGHSVSGTLNFPRRVATAFLCAGVWRRHHAFVAAMGKALARFGVAAPLYLLRADGGTQLASSFRSPAETALSGPAASIMGVQAMDALAGETLSLDVGGTTTDTALFTQGVPLLEPLGATIGPHRTQIRALFTRSTGVGGDSHVRVEGGEIRVGPHRLGPPASLGGVHPTPTDALVLLGRALGDRGRAADALAPIALALEVSPEEGARRVLQALARDIGAAARGFLHEVNARPVYTIHELLEGHRVAPVRAVAVGGPARAIAPYLEHALNLPVTVPDHYDVANAIGAALARVNLEVNLVADTGRGFLSIPEADVYRPVTGRYSLEEARAEAGRTLLAVAEDKGVLETDAAVDIAEEESFRIVEGFATVGSVHRVRAQIRPGILGRVA